MMSCPRWGCFNPNFPPESDMNEISLLARSASVQKISKLVRERKDRQSKYKKSKNENKHSALPKRANRLDEFV